MNAAICVCCLKYLLEMKYSFFQEAKKYSNNKQSTTRSTARVFSTLWTNGLWKTPPFCCALQKEGYSRLPSLTSLTGLRPSLGSVSGEELLSLRLARWIKARNLYSGCIGPAWFKSASRWDPCEWIYIHVYTHQKLQLPFVLLLYRFFDDIHG